MAKTQTHTVGSFLFELLYNRGAKHAFGIPGDFALPTFRWLEQSPIDLLTMTHEPAVGFAADAYARVNGLGVACVTYCVGGLNMVNSIAGAYAEKSPVLVISGAPSPNERRNDSLIHHKVRTFDTQRKIFEEITCANTVIDDPETAASEIMRVVDTVMLQCRPGYIEMPYDIVDLPIKLPRVIRNHAVQPDGDKESLEACLEEASQFINKAKRPVILAGVELHRHRLTDDIIRIAEKFNIPVAATLLSKSVFREVHPLYIGVYSGAFSEQECRDYVDNSDCVIMLGTFITDMMLGVYTSKLQRKQSILVTTEKAQVGLHGYSDVPLHDFVQGLERANITPRETFNNPAPPVEKSAKPSGAEREQPIEVEAFFHRLESHMPEGSTLLSDTGDALFGAMRIRTSKRQNFLSNAYYLSMGFSVPATVGAMANPEQCSGRTFCIVGDGAFQMTGLEVSTIAKYGMAPIIIILNNDGYGTQRFIIDGKFNEIHMWDYTKITDLLRTGKSYRVATMGELDDALSSAVADDSQLSVIEVVIPRSSCSPALRSVGEELGKLRDKGKSKKKTNAS